MTTVHVIIPSYNCERWIERCLESVAMQDHPDVKVLVIDDASTDGNAVLARRICDRQGWRFIGNHVNVRAGVNLYRGIHSMAPAPRDIIFILDGDDFLPHHRVLSRIAEVYEDPSVWLCWGQYEPHPHNTGQVPSRPYPPEWIDDAPNGRLRYEENLINHPITFRYWLFAELTEADMKDDDGVWFRAGYDRVMFIPMLEMAGHHHRFVDEVLYMYNAVNPISDTFVNLEDAQAAHKAVRQRTPKEPRPITERVTEQAPYGDVETGDSDVYRLGAKFLSDCTSVEDWGCGRGWFRRFIDAPYKGVDFGVDRLPAENDFVDEYADLRSYTGDADGIFMRAVLEHNLDWELILANAMKSFRHKLCLVIFTSFSDTTHPVGFDDRPRYDEPVPDMSFRLEDITDHFAGLEWTSERLENNSQYGEETLFYVTRP